MDKNYKKLYSKSKSLTVNSLHTNIYMSVSSFVNYLTNNLSEQIFLQDLLETLQHSQ